MKISVIGLGKLGAPLAAVFASKGFPVIGTDLNPAFVNAINAGRAPVDEPNLQELISDNRERLQATVDASAAVADTDVTFVIVPTPSDPDGRFTNRFILDAMQMVGAGPAPEDRLSRRRDHEHGNARINRRRDSCGARASFRSPRRRRPGPVLQPGVHRARHRRPRHAVARHDPDRRVRRAGRRHARSVSTSAAATTGRSSGG